MRNITARIFLIALGFLMPGTAALSQTTPETLKQLRSNVITVIDGKDYYIHTIKRGQSLYMISKAYGVEVNEIIRENPEVKEMIRADQKLRIPLKGPRPPEAKVVPPPGQEEEKKIREKKTKTSEKAAVTPSPKKPPVEIVKTEVQQPKPEPVPVKDTVIVVDLPCGQDTAALKPVYNVALMLPLYLGEVGRISTEKPDPAILETARPFMFLPFYEGFLMALDSLEKTGLKIKLYIYDVDKDTNRTNQILKKQEMKSMDLIFGLLYHRNFQMVAEFARKKHIPVINPISEKADIIRGNPSVIKVQPARSAMIDDLAAFIEKNFQGNKVLVIKNSLFTDKAVVDQLSKACRERSLDIKMVENKDAVVNALAGDRGNCVIAFSENPAYAFDLGRKLFELRNDHDITLFGLPDWSSMEGMDLDYLVSLKTHVIVPSFIDYSDPGVKKFVAAYQSEYHCDPSALAFQGYDMANYFLPALMKYGKSLSRCLGEFDSHSFLGRKEFRQTPENGFENKAWDIVKYENYRLINAE